MLNTGGIPDMMEALSNLISLSSGTRIDQELPWFWLSPIPFSNAPVLLFSHVIHDPVKVEIYSASGQMIHQEVFPSSIASHHEIAHFGKLPAGFYVVSVMCGNQHETLRAIKR